MTQVLEGIRVIEWAEAMAGPVAGHQLADLGAEVIKVEDPVRGDISRGYQMWAGGAPVVTKSGLALMFEHANRGKKSLVLDLKREEGRILLYKLVEKSDIFLHNHSESNAKKLNLEYETLKKHNPKLIYAHSFGLGTKGPYSHTRTFDITGQAWSGLMWQAGERDFDEPCNTSLGYTDELSGIVLAYGILAALACRERTGIGQKVETSMLGAEIFRGAYNINSVLWAGRALARHARRKARNPLGNHYRCADGKWILLSEIQSERFWPSFCYAMGLEHLEKDSRFSSMKTRANNCEELVRILDQTFSTKPRDEWIKILEEKGGGMSFSIINTVEDLVKEPGVKEHVLANEYIAELDDPRMEHPLTEKLMTTGSPFIFSNTPVAKPFRRAPEWGENTEEVLSEVLGLSWEEIEKLKDKGIVGKKQ